MTNLYRKSVKNIDWVFLKGTRTIAVINVVLLYSWALAYVIGHTLPNQTNIYNQFQGNDGYYWCAWLVFIATVQLILLSVSNIRCRILIGLMLIVSAISWLFVAFKFGRSFALQAVREWHGLMMKN